MTGLHLHKGQNASKLVLLKIGTVSRYPEFDGTPICLICSLVKSFNEYYYFKIVSKEKGRFFIMPCLSLVIFSLLWSWLTTLCHASPDIFCSKDKNFEFYNSFPTFWGQKMKFTIHLSLFTCYCSWHCLLQIFAYLRGVVPYISSKF